MLSLLSHWVQGGFCRKCLHTPFENDFFVQDGPVGLVNSESHWLSGLGNSRDLSKVGVLGMWTSSFRGEAGDLVLLLEQARGDGEGRASQEDRRVKVSAWMCAS